MRRCIIYVGEDFVKIYEALLTIRNTKLKINITVIEIYRDMLENLNFKQKKYSIISTGVYKIAHDSIRLMKWICYYDRSSYENLNYYDLMGSICKNSNEVTKR